MIRLAKSRTTILGVVLHAVAWLPVTHSGAWAADRCAVNLEVVSSDGRPIVSTSVELRNSDDKVVFSTAMKGSTLRICDFGFGAHSLRVGTNECLPVSISNLRLHLDSPLNIKVHLNSCGYRDQWRSGCLLYLRVTDGDGRPIPNAGVVIPGRGGTPANTDSYGRFQTLYSGTHEIAVQKEGYEPGRVSANCSTTEQLDRGVVMRRVTRQ